MIETSTILTYLAIVTSFLLMPGPATLLVLARASSGGVKNGLASAAGITLGDILHTLMAVVGISAVISTSPMLFTLIKTLGAIYLLYLGVRAIFFSNTLKNGTQAVSTSHAKAFRQAFITELLNPKTTMFYLTFLPQFVHIELGYIELQLVVLGTVFTVLGFINLTAIAFFSGRLSKSLRNNPRTIKWQNRIFGILYFGLSVRLILLEI